MIEADIEKIKWHTVSQEEYDKTYFDLPHRVTILGMNSIRWEIGRIPATLPNSVGAIVAPDPSDPDYEDYNPYVLSSDGAWYELEQYSEPDQADNETVQDYLDEDGLSLSQGLDKVGCALSLGKDVCYPFPMECSVCHRVDPECGFFKNPRTICKECKRTKQRAYYQRRYNDDSEFRASEIERANAKRMQRHRRLRYGLSEDEYQALLIAQDNKCAICNQELPLEVDHSHTTNQVRGLLCQACNLVLGHAHDDPAILQAAISYLLQAVNTDVDTHA